MGRTCAVEAPGRYSVYCTSNNFTTDNLLSVWKHALLEHLDVGADHKFDELQAGLGARKPVDVCTADSQVNHVFEKVQSEGLIKDFPQESKDKNEAVAGLNGEGLLSNALRNSELTPASLIAILHACANEKDLCRGRELHAYIHQRGLLKKSISITTALVSVYFKCSALGLAEDLFDGIFARNVASWNALVDGYIQLRHMQSAQAAFHQMTQECIFPSSLTYVYILKACASLGDANNGKAVHAQIGSQKLPETDHIVGTALIYMYARCNLLREAEEAFHMLATRDTVSWNVLISGYALHEHGEKAIESFQHMQSEGFSPNAATFIGMLKACGSIKALNNGQALHAEILKEGLLAKRHVGNVLVAMYAKCGILSKAQEVFDVLVDKDVVSWSTLITGYSLHSRSMEALRCFDQMQQKGLSPNSISFGCMLKACSSIGASNGGQEIHAMILKEDWIRKDIRIGSVLVDMYIKCGALHKAQEVFDELPIRSALVWTALISGYAQAGQDEAAFKLFYNMIKEGKEPDSVTYVTLLNACSNGGLLCEGQLCFGILTECRMFPTLRHFTRIVDLFARAGQLETAAALICKVPYLDNLTMWHSFLGACQKWENVQFGRWAFYHAIQCDALDATAYVIMSNVNDVAQCHEAPNKFREPKLMKV